MYVKNSAVKVFTSNLAGCIAIHIQLLIYYIYINKQPSVYYVIFFLWLDSPIWAWASSFRRGFMVTHN
jgi:hypothetical protein